MVNHHLKYWSLTPILVLLTHLIQIASAQTKCNFTVPFSKNDVKGIMIKNPEYSDNIYSCWHMVKVEQGFGILLEFESFNLQEKACFDENNNPKCCDYLQIGTGNQVHKNVYNTLCGSDKIDPIYLESNTVWFNFHTDGSVNMDGYKIKVNKLKLSYTEPTGQISVPVESKTLYTNNLNLTYKIQTEENSVIFLRFERLSIESFNNSCIDFLEIGSLEPKSKETPRVICGDDTVKKLIINSNQIYLRFYSDKSETWSGFSVFYNTIKNFYTEPTGVIESSMYAMNFTYKIVAPEDKLIELMVENFNFKKCLMNNAELLVESSKPFCSLNNDYLMFQNEKGSLNGTLYKEINNLYSSVKGMDVSKNWIFCGCVKPVKMYLSLTNELSISHFVSQRDQIGQDNYFKLSYKFVPAEHTGMDNLRVVQNNVKTGFIGGYILNIQVPANNHLRLYGKSAKCSLPKQSLIVKEQNDQILSINQLSASNEDLKKNCSYTIDFSEPKSDFFISNKNHWRFTWFLKIDSPSDMYDFEINWLFMKNQIMDEKRDFEITLPKISGFELTERVHDELQFYFKTTTNRRYTLSFLITPKYFIDLHDTGNYIKTRAKNSNKIDTFIPTEHLNNIEAGFVLNPIDSLLKIRRNSKYSIRIFASLDRENGDCNFDDSVCDFTLNPFINQTVFPSLFTSNDAYTIRHMPKFTDLHSNDFEIDEKSKDFYLMITRTNKNDDALYSPLITVQDQEPNGKWNFNRRVYSISFSYMMSNLTTSDLEIFFVQNRTDAKLRNDFFRETIGIFNRDSIIDNVIVSEPKISNECPSDSFSFFWNDKSKKSARSESQIDSPITWYRVNRARFFSCFDFRFGFSVNLEDVENTKINPITSTIGLDDIELNDEGELSYCSDKNCNNNGKCFEYNGKATCCCNPGYEGDRCENKVNACDTLGKVCKNDGKCRNIDKSFDYKCECANGFTGKNCEIEINECDSKPCLNDGKCIDLIGGYECVCRNGFNGKKCELKDDRCKDQCSPIGTAECFIDRSNVICKCKRDFTGDDCTRKIKINKCFDDPCVGNAKCVPDGAGFKCLCPPDRTGTFCEKNVNFCDNFENLCRNGSACIFASEDASKFKCSCEAGFTGKHCDEPIDDCEQNPCVNGKCIDLHLGYKCECYKGFMGKHCDIIPKNPCYKHKCMNGVCVPNQGNYTCECHKNYRGEFCDEEKCDQEAFMNKVCSREGTLKVVSNDKKCLCLCKKDYIGEKCETRLNLCELRAKTFEMEEECLNGGTCTYNNKTNEVKCLCAAGFFGDRCQIIENYCKSNPCKHGNCKSDHDSYKCTCSKGWKGRNCDEQNNDCSLSEDCVASNTDKVLFSKNQCVCVCKHGFTGDRCQINIDNCDPNPCRNGGKCKDLVGSFDCECPVGFSGPYCEKKITDCENNPCKNGTCVMHGSQLTCNCDFGYTGEFCEKFIDKCDPNPCKNDAKCHNLINDYYCECPEEFGETKNCSLQIVNPCDSSPCFNNGKCNPKASSIVKMNGRNVNTYNGFKCQCQSNFKGEFCEQSVDPCSSNPCKNRGKCILNKGDQSIKCVCAAAFTGKYCDTFIDPCSGKTACLNGGICLPTTIGPKCQCPSEFTGEHCELAKSPCDLMKCLNGGQCAVFNNVPYCKCPNTRFIGTRCEIDISANNSLEVSFTSALTNPMSALSCDLLGNDVGAIDYIFLALIVFGLIILVIASVYVYVYVGIKRTKKYHSQVQHDNDILGEIHDIDKRYL